MNKFRVMIVDDESIVRIGLKSIVDWENSPFELVADAKDGSEALELAKQLRPDIVLTDIKMPVMDGIALIRALGQLPFAVHVIVLSSYNDFPLVREAMKLGAEDYLLKLDLNPEDLLQVLGEVALRAGTRAAHAYPDRLPEMQRSYLKKAVSRFYLTDAELENTLGQLQIDLGGSPIYAMLIKAGELYRFEDTSEQDLHTLNFSVINITEEIARDYFHAYCFEVKTGEFAVLMTSGRDDPAMTVDERVQDTAARVRDMLDQYLNISCTIGIGMDVRAAAGLADAYDRAAQAITRRFYCENDGILVWSAQNTAPSAGSRDWTQEKELLFSAIKNADPQKIGAALDLFCSSMKQDKLGREAVGSLAIELQVTVHMALEKLGVDAAQALSDSLRPHQELLHLHSFSQVEQWLAVLYQDLERFFGKRSTKYCFRAVQLACDFMKKHYRSPISLSEVAAEVSLSPSYLSTLLKRYQGVSYHEYLIGLRIEKAKRLLAETDWKVYEIGSHVGFDNKFYFNRIFKQITGISPGDYRKLNWQAGETP